MGQGTVPEGAVAVAIEPLPPAPALDAGAGALLAECTPERTAAAGRTLLAKLRADPETALYGLVFEETVLLVYALRRVPMSLELTHVAVAPPLRKQGLGRACLHDALARAGAKPLVAETDDVGLAFFKACGFKLFAKRQAVDGSVRYRLGAHAPRRSGE